MSRRDSSPTRSPTTLPEEPNGALYLDDLKVGQRFASRTIEVERERIISFASEFDPQPFHLSDGLARDTLFRGLPASGWHKGALTMRLLVDGGLPIAGGLVHASVEIQWPLPTRPSDVLHVDSEILDITPSQSHSNRGAVVARGETRNQRDEVVQITKVKLIVARRPS
jgi:acyl dehydratase